MQGSANLNVMMKAAYAAGRSLAKDFREVEHLQVSVKGPGDFVSKADLAAEEIIREQLTEARPTYGWLGEESGFTEGKDPTRRWIVDPLDGTTNFLHGMPHWAVSVALEHKGEVVAAVVYDAAKDEMFYAEKGGGAWLNDKQRLRVSGRNKMIESVFAGGMPCAGGKYLPASLKDHAALAPQCAGMRHMGSAALSLAYVAAGRHEGYWARGLKTWDVAGGMLLVTEAGGLLEPMREGQNVLEDGHLICANNEIFDKFSKVIREA